jgi:hypothetical protein
LQALPLDLAAKAPAALASLPLQHLCLIGGAKRRKLPGYVSRTAFARLLGALAKAPCLERLYFSSNALSRLSKRKNQGRFARPLALLQQRGLADFGSVDKWREAATLPPTWYDRFEGRQMWGVDASHEKWFNFK